VVGLGIAGQHRRIRVRWMVDDIRLARHVGFRWLLNHELSAVQNDCPRPDQVFGIRD